MHESTPLTRHLAAQGLKVKLRTDTTVGRQLVYRSNTSVTVLTFVITAGVFDDGELLRIQQPLRLLLS